jgi:hypothetical protein
LLEHMLQAFCGDHRRTARFPQAGLPLVAACMYSLRHSMHSMLLKQPGAALSAASNVQPNVGMRHKQS